MKKQLCYKVLMGLLSLLFSGTIIAQTPFQIGFGGTSYEVPYSSLQANDGTFVIAGVTASFHGSGMSGYEAYVTKISATGTIVWSKAIGGGGEDIAFEIRQTSDNGFIVAGKNDRQMHLFKLTPTGDLSWSKTYNGTANRDSELKSLLINSDNGYTFAGETVEFSTTAGVDAVVGRTDNTGTLTWLNAYSSPNVGAATPADKAYRIVATTGGYWVTGSKEVLGLTDVFAMKLNTDGTVNFTKQINFKDYDEGRDIINLTDGGCIIACRASKNGEIDSAAIIRLSATGTVTWAKTLGFSYQTQPDWIRLDNDGNILVGLTGGSLSLTATDDAIVTKMNSTTGALISVLGTYGALMGDETNYGGGRRTADGGMMNVALTFNYGPGDRDIFLSKTTSTGAIAPNCDRMNNAYGIKNITPTISDLTMTSTAFGEIKTTTMPITTAATTIENANCTPIALAVEMVNLSIQPLAHQKALLEWQTIYEMNNEGFEIQQLKNNSWEKIGFLKGNGTTQKVNMYRFETNDLERGTHYFRLNQLDFDGKNILSKVVSVTINDNGKTIGRYNSFNQTFELQPSETLTNARLQLFDALGRNVKTFFQGNLEGNPTFDLNGMKGMYFLKLESETVKEVWKLNIF